MLKRLWSKCKNATVILAVVVDIVAILGLFGLDQQTIGDAAYSCFTTFGPIVIAIVSLFIGWQWHSLFVDTETKKAVAVEQERDRQRKEQEERAREIRLQEEKKEAERLRSRLFELPDSYKAILFEAVMNEVVTTSGEESIAAESLEKEGLLVKLDTRLLAGQSWKASDRARNTIHPKDHFLWTDFRDAPRQRLLKE